MEIHRRLKIGTTKSQLLKGEKNGSSRKEQSTGLSLG